MATLDFKGKALVQNYHLTVKHHELVPKREKSLTDKVRLDDNLIIHGDNLKALKALLPTYAGKVKCIYIDPPYNTGNEGWTYNDNVNSPMMQEWLGKTVDRDDLTRHDKWLCLMTPRLKLLRELLADDGVIFISIDDNESHRLRMMMDEVFGEENFLAEIIWQKSFSPRNNAPTFSVSHEYIICWARKINQANIKRLPMGEAQKARYSNPDNDPRGVWTSSDLTVSLISGQRGQQFQKTGESENLYKVKSPTGKAYSAPSGRCWVYSERKFLELDKDERVWWGENRSNMPRLKRFLNEIEGGLIPQTIWMFDEVGHTQEASQEIKEIFSENTGVAFPTPKTSRLLTRILQIASEKDSLVLDSFAGSGTTAHAVLALNKEDGGNRKFILIECEDYANGITAERVRRVIKGVKGARDGNLRKGLGGKFSYFELGKPIELESILDGKNLPGYHELARYVFYTATGEEFDECKVNERRQFVGESMTHEVYLFYRPDIDYLKKTALTLERAEILGKPKNKRRLVFAPTKYLDQEQLDELRIDFAQLPFEIYKLAQ
jgi:adenine-specific DNA-methyltransferase